MDRVELMAEIERRWRLIDDLVAEADTSVLARPAGGPEAPPEGWSVGEVLLHMAAWKRRALAVARVMAEKPSTSNDEANDLLFTGWQVFNNGHRDRSRGTDARSILVEHSAAHVELVAALEALPEACLLERGRARLWLRPLMAHTFDHLKPDLLPAFAQGPRRS